MAMLSLKVIIQTNVSANCHDHWKDDDIRHVCILFLHLIYTTPVHVTLIQTGTFGCSEFNTLVFE
jgi:hypothetical protein